MTTATMRSRSKNITCAKIDRTWMAARPNGGAAGYHRWTDLTFLHWKVPASEIEPLIPDRLTLDTYDGYAWVGVVPFHLCNVRPWWAPAMPMYSEFHETNVRTYVHLDGADPGVLFLSLDASKALPVRWARAIWNLPYYRAEMELTRSYRRTHYKSRRLWPGEAGPSSDIDVELGELINRDDPTIMTGRTKPGSLDEFLVDRYLLYTEKNGDLLCGHVHHRPYEIRELSVNRCEETLTRAAGIEVCGPPDHACYSEAVDVDVFALNRI